METPPSPAHVVIAYDATKERTEHELQFTIKGVRLRGDILRSGDTLVVFGVLHRVTHPCKCLFDQLLCSLSAKMFMFVTVVCLSRPLVVQYIY